MMRPMKLAGTELLFGQGTLAYLSTLNANRVVIVLAEVMYKNGVMDMVHQHLEAAGIPYSVFVGVEPEPGFRTVLKGAAFLLEENPDLIIALGGGSVMDAAKAMWIYYEHPHLKSLDALKDKDNFPRLRNKARFCCIPSTAGTGSEVSRSIVITDDETGYKHGIGNMEMMPDIAICDPVTTISMPPHITAETGMDAMAHAVEAIVSNRANYVSDILAERAILDIINVLPQVYENGDDIKLREQMLNASLVAGMAFTNVSLGIVHSLAHSLGSLFKLPHGLANAILLPYVVDFNAQDPRARSIYQGLANKAGVHSLAAALKDLNRQLNIPEKLKDRIPSETQFMDNLAELVRLSIDDGCTKTNPIIPTREQLRTLALTAYHGKPCV